MNTVLFYTCSTLQGTDICSRYVRWCPSCLSSWLVGCAAGQTSASLPAHSLGVHLGRRSCRSWCKQFAAHHATRQNSRAPR